ncbi:MAG TPA: histidine kinase [Thermomonospora sp.]|nr:histidine kinase [Thermomonospora sp.]
MGRAVVTVLVFAAEAGRAFTDLPLWAAAAHALAVAAVLAAGWWRPVPAFPMAAALACLPGGGDLLLVWAAYRAGHHVASRRGAVALAAGVALYTGGRLAADPARPSLTVATLMVLVGLPMAVGLYLAQHRRLVETLDEHNRQLRSGRELLAERERLRERLRIARDVHDSLGHRLGLLSVQAAALEVGDLPEHQREAVRRLAGTARQAMDELHDLVGTLRRADDPAHAPPGVADLDELAEGFRSAGVPVTLREHGDARPLSPSVAHAAYRVVEEGLTNAAKHAPDAEVTVTLDWEPDALLVTVANDASGTPAGGHGHGLVGLDERVRLAGGLLRTVPSETEFQVIAMLPLAETTPEDPTAERPPGADRARRYAVGFGLAALVCLVFPMAGFG